ncbi:MAG: hypothetical protein LBM06_06900 [Prevotellaceae bacterium]|jgi:hypothetical protein|nr:hypothetical protein [Prevotellaceae bacterium]
MSLNLPKVAQQVLDELNIPIKEEVEPEATKPKATAEADEPKAEDSNTDGWIP